MFQLNVGALFKIRTHVVAQAVLEFIVVPRVANLLPQPSESWDYRNEPLCPTPSSNLKIKDNHHIHYEHSVGKHI